MKRHTIPIPSSFSTSAQVSSETIPDKKRRIPINEQWLIKLESALQLHFVHFKTNQISYEEFCTLVPKLELERGNDDTIVDDGNSESLLLLETSERLWHDFICVVVPTLFTRIHDWELGMVKFAGNRLQEVRRLVRMAQEQGVSESLSLQIMDSLAQRNKMHAEKERTIIEATRIDPIQSTDQQSPAVNDKIATLSELEHRIRAKAQERRRLLERVQEEAPYDDKIRVADAIFAFARQRLRQRPGGRFRTASLVATGTTTNTKCRVVVSDLLEQAVPGYTMTKFLTVLQRLAETGPAGGWISWDGGNTLEPTTTITIETAHYKTVRASITGTVEDVQTPQQDTKTKSTVPAVTVSGNKRVAVARTLEQSPSKQARAL